MWQNSQRGVLRVTRSGMTRAEVPGLAAAIGSERFLKPVGWWWSERRWRRKSSERRTTEGALAGFLQYNTLNEKLPQYDDLPRRLLRSAFIGFCSSAISDTCSNSIRVVKTSKQAATEAVTYPQVVRVTADPLPLGTC